MCSRRLALLPSPLAAGFAVLALSSPVDAQAQIAFDTTLSFGSATDLNSFTPASPANWSVSGGFLVAAKDSVAGSINGGAYNQAFSFATDNTTLTVSAIYRFNGTNLASTFNGPVLMFGLDSNPADFAFTTGDGFAAQNPDFRAGLIRNSASNRNHQLQNSVQGTGTTFNAAGTSYASANTANANLAAALTSYVITTVFTRLSSTQLQVVTTLATAAAPGTALLTQNNTYSVGATYFDSQLHTGLLLNGDPTSAAEGITIDDFRVVGTVVPEPSAFAAFAGLGALGFAASRRRRA